MRSSIWLGVLLLALGGLFSWVASTLMGIAGEGFEFFASSFGAVLFVFVASLLLGVGAALVIQWLADFAHTILASTIKIVCAIALFFIGLGLAIASRNWWIAIHLFFACVIASITLFILSFATLVGGAVKGTEAVARKVRKKIRAKRK